MTHKEEAARFKFNMLCYLSDDLNGYSAVFPGSNNSDKICVTELNEILLNSMPNICIKQEYIQRFDFCSITFKSSVNMF